jgi:uncharacterized protein (TIGR03437 family)
MGFAGVQSYLTPTLQIAGNATILPRAEWPSLALANVSAAGYGLGPLAPGSIVTAFGQNLTTQTAQASGALPVLLGGVAVSVTDSSRVARPAQLYYVSPGQVNYLIPPDTAAGLATVSITANGITAASGPIEVATVAPSLFTVNADGLAAANAVRVSENGDQTFEPIYQTDQNGNITALPIDLGSDTDAVYLVLYGTGIRNVGRFSAASATIGGRFEAPLGYLGAQATYAGLDQVNIQLPKLLASPLAQTWGIQLMAGGQPSNQVTVLIQGVARAPGGSIRSGRLPSGRVARRGARGHS